MDLLSDVLSRYHAEDANTGSFTFRGAWCFSAQQMEGPLIRIGSGAPFWLDLPGQIPLRVREGDVVLLPHGSAHRIGTDLGQPAVALSQWLPAARNLRERGEKPLVLSHGERGPLTELFTAIVSYGPNQQNPLLQLLPPLVHLPADDVRAAPSLVSTMEMLIKESLNREPGWRLSVARMVDLLLIYLVRLWLEHDGDPSHRWLLGLSDPRISRAILLMHQNPARPWKLDGLAAEVGLSRARFAARFRNETGVSPMAFLLRYRMELAARYLHDRHNRISAIAQRVGYDSEKSFSRAFRLWAGVAPSRYGERDAPGQP